MRIRSLLRRCLPVCSFNIRVLRVVLLLSAVATAQQPPATFPTEFGPVNTEGSALAAPPPVDLHPVPIPDDPRPTPVSTGSPVGHPPSAKPVGTAATDGLQLNATCEHCQKWWSERRQLHSRERCTEAINSALVAPDNVEEQLLPAAVTEISEPTLIGNSSLGLNRAPRSANDDQDRPTSSSDNVTTEYGTVVFGETARFPIRGVGFDRCGLDRCGVRSVERDAAVIYEGMAIQFDNEGNYTVKFTMEAPATRALVRLQFVIWDTDPGSGDPPRALGTVTVPPLRFQPGRDELRSGNTLVWQARQSGYSPLLRCLTDTGCDGRFRIERTGAAEFGNVPVRTASY